MKARWSDLVAMGFLIAAVVVFGLYQILVEYRTFGSSSGLDAFWEETHGYEVWMRIYDAQEAGYLDHFYRFMIAGMVIGLIVTVISPFLISILVRSRPIWWMLICCSGLSVVGVVGCSVWMQISEDYGESWDFEVGPGYNCFLAFPVLNFIGLLCVRRQTDVSGISRPV